MQLLITGDDVAKKDFVEIVTSFSGVIATANTLIVTKGAKEIEGLLRESYEPLGVSVFYWESSQYQPNPFGICHAALVVKSGNNPTFDMPRLANWILKEGVMVYLMDMKKKQITVRKPYYHSRFALN